MDKLLCWFLPHTWHYATRSRRHCLRCGQREVREDGCWMIVPGHHHEEAAP